MPIVKNKLSSAEKLIEHFMNYKKDLDKSFQHKLQSLVTDAKYIGLSSGEDSHKHISEQNNQISETLQNINKIDHQIEKIRYQEDSKNSNDILDKFVSYKDQNRKAIAQNKQANFGFNVSEKIIPKDYVNLEAMIHVLNTHGEEVFKTKQKVQYGGNKFTWDSLAKPQAIEADAEYHIVVDVEGELNGKKVNFPDIPDGKSRVIKYNQETHELSLGDGKKITKKQISDLHSSAENEKLLRYNNLIGRYAETKDKKHYGKITQLTNDDENILLEIQNSDLHPIIIRSQEIGSIKAEEPVIKNELIESIDLASLTEKSVYLYNKIDNIDNDVTCEYSTAPFSNINQAELNSIRQVDFCMKLYNSKHHELATGTKKFNQAGVLKLLQDFNLNRQGMNYHIDFAPADFNKRSLGKEEDLTYYKLFVTTTDDKELSKTYRLFDSKNIKKVHTFEANSKKITADDGSIISLNDIESVLASNIKHA